MKRALLILSVLIGLVLPTYAKNVMPSHVSNAYNDTLGVYQADKEITLYETPDVAARVIKQIKWSGDELLPTGMDVAKLFLVYLPYKELAFLVVTDETDDWVEVFYDNENGLRGWVKKDDPYRFMSWITFYNIYGKKYGLYMLKDTPATIKDLHSATEDSSQVVSHLNYPEQIKLNVLRGNWALVSVMDLDRTPKTGYMRWRSDNGVKYLFPNIK